MLAIAAAKLWRRPVLATDIDLGSVLAARGNARLNGVGPLVECVHAAGFDAPQITARGPFDLVFANILLGPLKRLAAPMGRTIPPGANVILSGLMVAHVPAAHRRLPDAGTGAGAPDRARGLGDIAHVGAQPALELSASSTLQRAVAQSARSLRWNRAPAARLARLWPMSARSLRWNRALAFNDKERLIGR